MAARFLKQKIIFLPVFPKNRVLKKSHRAVVLHNTGVGRNYAFSQHWPKNKGQEELSMKLMLLQQTDREATKNAVLRYGIDRMRDSKNEKVSAYFAETLAEKDPIAAYGYLLRAVRQGLSVPSAVLEAAADAARATGGSSVSYEGALLAGRELMNKDPELSVYFLHKAAIHPEDKWGVAALFLGDVASSRFEWRELSREFYRVAAAKGNPDILPCFNK